MHFFIAQKDKEMENNGSQATGKEVEANRLQGQEENRRLLDQYRGRKNKKQFMGCRIYSNLETGDIIIFRHDGKLLVKRIAAMANAFMVSGLTKTYQIGRASCRERVFITV